ncbi:hypothetical protein [Thermobrachium celere]|uniref:Uncharacterized protein n=1 Tax=Thermobrachium celere DSM 8682 TaxID=941824 RepID=R7RUJ0_9CLOT|nr:hypothetical protein [Thermobrachium celere]GFR35653.1 hypothetical protein TCEA9_14650 [Thermobrachium celere]CDF59088.1 hypothetical protein TCEL_02156 [Thermobrachium celere DSM 8682]
MKVRYEEINIREIDRSFLRYMRSECRYCGYRMRASNKDFSCKNCMLKNSK